MSIAAHASPVLRRRGGTRWLLLGSLALNLFFVGIALALAIRAPAPPRWDPDVFVRVRLLSATLPPADAAILADAMQANHQAIQNTQASYETARNAIRATLRKQDFKADEMRAEMAKTRAARQSFDKVIQDVFADAAAKMSPSGRLALANWRADRKFNGSGK